MFAKTVSPLLITLTLAFVANTVNGFLPDEIDQDEIIRRGEWVEKVGEIRANQLHSIEAAFATPPDDSHKWYISIICTKGCKYCDKLKYDFEHDKTLEAWVNVNDPAKSWAHYQVYQIEDQTQKARFSKIRIKGFPTLLIQPPRNGNFGSSATVVWQKTGYDGNTEKLSREMSNAIKRYVSAVNEDRQNNPKEANVSEVSDKVLDPDEKQKFSATPETEEIRASGATPNSDTIGVEPPFSLPNRDEGGQNNNINIAPEVTGVLRKNELHDLLPNASDEFIHEMLKLGVNREEALRRWSLHKESSSFSGVVHYIFVAIITLAAIAFLVFLLVIGISIILFVYRKFISSNPPPIKEKVTEHVIHEHDIAPQTEELNALKKRIKELEAAKLENDL